MRPKRPAQVHGTVGDGPAMRVNRACDAVDSLAWDAASLRPPDEHRARPTRSGLRATGIVSRLPAIYMRAALSECRPPLEPDACAMQLGSQFRSECSLDGASLLADAEEFAEDVELPRPQHADRTAGSVADKPA